MSDFSIARKGDRVWSILQGWGTVEKVDLSLTYPVAVQFDNQQRVDFTVDGKVFERDIEPVLYWDKVAIGVPLAALTPPERMVKKYIKLYKPKEHPISLVGYGMVPTLFGTQEEADTYHPTGFKYYGPFEVEVPA